MGIVIALTIGAILGWLASIVMRADTQRRIFANIIAGTMGAVLAGIVIAPLLGGSSVNSDSFDLLSLAVSVAGAMVLVAVVSLAWRDSNR